jgi:membrane protease YdiL (CAAX protease family)
MEAERKGTTDQQPTIGQQPTADRRPTPGQGSSAMLGAEAGRVSAREPGAASGRAGTLGILKMIASFVVLFLSTILPVAALFGLGDVLGAAAEDNLVFTSACALGAVIGVCVLGGASMFRLSRSDLAHVWKVGRGILIITVVMTIMQATSFLTGEATLSPTWPTDVLYCLALCLAIGLYEESFVRGVLFNGLLAPFGRWRAGLLASAVLSSVFFGCMHINWATLDYGDALQASQALLKILQTTIYGVVLCACVAKENRLTAAALYHALDDFLLMVIPCGLIGETVETEYVSTGESGAVSVVLYAILIVLYMPSLIRAIRELASLPLPRRGGFVRAVAPAPGNRPADPRPAATTVDPCAPSKPDGAPVAPDLSHASECSTTGGTGDGPVSPTSDNRPVRPW